MFDQTLLRLKREIRDLKTSHDRRSNMRTFSYSITIPEMQAFTATTIRLTYAAGEQPILTTVVGSSKIIPMEPTGTTQDFVFAYGVGWWLLEQTAFFLSTRPITNIQLVSV